MGFWTKAQGWPGFAGLPWVPAQTEFNLNGVAPEVTPIRVMLCFRNWAQICKRPETHVVKPTTEPVAPTVG